jgi:hypothetical protein
MWEKDGDSPSHFSFSPQDEGKTCAIRLAGGAGEIFAIWQPNRNYFGK